MKQFRTNKQLWLSGKGYDINATLRRMMMKEGKDAKISDILNKPQRK
ncbi:hypothetical protein NQ117_05040 [Paenibacillus sp. SC116]|nr:hypothetical protein [Paenibacillus sp. SC116]MCR8843038.1 hypothetical protein [Paenibacillus sp. SC116]